MAYAPEGLHADKKGCCAGCSQYKASGVKIGKKQSGNGKEGIEETDENGKRKYNEAIVYTDVAEDMALQQIKQLCDMEFAADARIRIMPDVTRAPAVRSVRP